LSVTATATPVQPASIIGNANLCGNSNATYSVTSVNSATSYTWTLPSGWSGTSSTNSILTSPVVGTGNVSVTANNSCGTSAAKILAVTVNSLPTQPGSISGATTACSSISSDYSITPVIGATSYVWTLPTGWNGTSTTTSISATPNLNAGNISVVATNSCGTSIPRTLAITVSTLPFAVLTSPANAICEGSNATF